MMRFATVLSVFMASAVLLALPTQVVAQQPDDVEPVHMRMNIAYYDEFSLENDETLDFAVCNWGLMPETGSPFLSSIAEVRGVTGVHLDTADTPWRAYFEVTLTNGSAATYSAFMDPETFYLYGAAG